VAGFSDDNLLTLLADIIKVRKLADKIGQTPESAPTGRTRLHNLRKYSGIEYETGGARNGKGTISVVPL
jgi:hypothetical protein